MKSMREKLCAKKITAGIVILALFSGVLPIEKIPEAKAEQYFGSNYEERVYLSQGDLITPGHTGNIRISGNQLTVTGWSYVWGGEFKYGKDGWDGNRGKWSKKKQTYILDEKCEYGDADTDYLELEDAGITKKKFEEKLKKYRKQKGIGVVLLKNKNVIKTLAFCKTGKITSKEKLKKKEYCSVYAKGNFECDPENYGAVYMKDSELIIKGNMDTSMGTLKKKTRKYAISSKCTYTYEHKDISKKKMNKVLRDFRNGKHSDVFLVFKNGKVTGIELASRV